MRKSEASAKTPADAANTNDEDEYINTLREHPYVPLPSHEGALAPPWRQGGTFLPGYTSHQPPPIALGFSNAPQYPPPEATSAPYPTYQYPPAIAAADSLQASISLAHLTQAASSLHGYHQLRESMVYEQLDRAVAAGPLHGMASPGSLRDPYTVPVGTQFPPWQTAPSVASQLLPRLAPESSNLLYTPGSTAPDGQYFPPQTRTLPSPHHQANEPVPVEARALVEASMYPSNKEVKPREKQRQLTRASDAFPVKLFRLLSELESNKGNQDIASFTASGQAFQIFKPLEFMRDVAQRYFRQKHFSSFTRQLNCYGFGKIPHGPDKGAFYHPNFQRDKPELCKSITAKATEDYRSARVA
jgi:hypothetical protein